MKKVLALFLFAAIMMSAQAQDEPKAVKHENVTWCEVVMIDFKPGKMKRALEIVELYKKAGEVAQTPKPEMHKIQTGEYDMMLIWEWKEGPSALEWKWSPDGVKWWKEFVKQQGKEKAESLSDEYSSLVSRSNSFITIK